MCNREQLLFAADEHGYNAEIDTDKDLLPPKPQPKEPEAPRTEYGCSECGSRPVHIWARFEHRADTCEDSFAESLSDGREQDFFGWFTLVGRCSKCRALRRSPSSNTRYPRAGFDPASAIVRRRLLYLRYEWAA